MAHQYQSIPIQVILAIEFNSYMGIMSKHLSKFTAIVLVAIAVHAVFCIQVFKALPDAMVLDGGSLLVFFPDYVLMYCMPVAYPLQNGRVNYADLWIELLGSFPVSMLYGIMVTAIFSSIKKAKKQSKVNKHIQS